MPKKPVEEHTSIYPNIGETVWQELLNVDQKYTKPFTRNGFTGTSISHVHGRMVMTKLFGPHGLGWGFSASNFADDGETVTCDGHLWYRPYYVDPCYPWELICNVFDSGSIGKMMENEDGTKRPTTDPKKGATRDAMNACLMALGHGASIYAGLLEPPGQSGQNGNSNSANGHPGKNAGTPQAESNSIKASDKQESAEQLNEAQISVLNQLTQQHPLLNSCEHQFKDDMLWFKIKTPTNQAHLKELQNFGFQPKGNGHLYFGVSLKAA